MWPGEATQCLTNTYILILNRKIYDRDLTGVANALNVAEATQCLTNTFSITNQENLPLHNT